MGLIQIFSQSVNQKVFRDYLNTKPNFLCVECFSILCGMILADSKRGKILMPNDIIALGFCSYKPTFSCVRMKLHEQDLMN